MSWELVGDRTPDSPAGHRTMPDTEQSGVRCPAKIRGPDMFGVRYPANIQAPDMSGIWCPANIQAPDMSGIRCPAKEK